MASETTQAGQAASEHAVGMPQLDFSTFPNQIFWLVVTLLIIYLVLNRVALPRIASVLAERHGAIANDLEQAEVLKHKAVEAEEAYNVALAEARGEAGKIVADAKAEMQKELDAAIAQADAGIAVKAAESEGKIAEIRAAAVKDVAEVAKATAAEVVNAVMPSVDAKGVDAAVTARMKG